MRVPLDARSLLLSVCLVIPMFGSAAPPGDWTGAVRVQAITLSSGDVADVYAPVIPRKFSQRFEDAFPLVVVLQGALVDKSDYSQFGRRLAADGYVVVIPNHYQFIPGFGTALFTEVSVLTEALDQVTVEDGDSTSHLFRIVDTNRLGVVGHSYGGAVAINAAAGVCEPPFLCKDVDGDDQPNEISFFDRGPLKAVVVYGSSRTDVDRDTSGVAVALLQGTLDGVAAPIKADQTLPLLEQPHALIAITGANHYGICNENNPAADPNTPTLDQQAGLDQIVTWTDRWLRANLGALSPNR